MLPKSQRIKKKGVFQRIASIALIVIFVLLGIGFLVFSNLKISQKRKDLLAQIAKLEEEIKLQEQKNQELKAGISQISNQDFLEKEARERLGLKKPGEEVVSVSKVETQSSEQETKQEKSIWQKFLEIFRR